MTNRWRWIAVVAFAVLAVGLFARYATLPPVRYGDGWEYAYHLESLYRHGTPDLRDDDRVAVNALFPTEGVDHPPETPYSYYEARNGRHYGMHFWAYSLSCVPAKAVLRAAGGNELAAFQVTNVAWFLLALGVALFGSGAPLPKRLLFAGLACVGPAIWYISYTGAEVFSWSLAVIAAIALDRQRYGWAATAAGLGAMQNPPLVFFAGACVAIALWRRQWRSAAGACIGTGLAFLPPLFYFIHFGTPSLISRDSTDIAGISLIRSWGLATDLNQGMLPYAPFVLIGAVLGATLLIYRRNAVAVLLVPAIAAMWVTIQLQANWNGGCLGMMRYLLWIVPALGWLAVEGLGGQRIGRTVLVVGVLIQGFVVAAWEPTRAGYLTHGPAAKWVLGHAPRLYNPEPEIFVERVVHYESPAPEVMPVAFVRPDGRVTKLLVDAASVDRIAERFAVSPDYLPELRRAVEGRRGPVYIHPPRGKVWANPQPEPAWLMAR